MAFFNETLKKLNGWKWTDYLLEFCDKYDTVHVPIVTGICAMGFIGHSLVILVLTRPKVFNPNNLLLTSLSGCQLLLLMSYLFFTYNKIYAERQCDARFWSFGWVWALLISIELNILIHTAALFHVVALSVIRYLTIIRRTGGCTIPHSWLTWSRCIKCIAIIYIFSVICCMPIYLLSSSVSPVNNRSRPWCPKNKSDPSVYYQITISSLSKDYPWLYGFNFWYYGILCKLLPSCIILVMSLLLVRCLRRLHRKAKLLKPFSRLKVNQTTYLSLTVMTLCLLVELPQSLLNLWAGLIGQRFLIYYSRITDIFEMLTVLYSSVNFLILCLMSGQFRRGFLSIWRKFCIWCYVKEEKEQSKQWLDTSRFLRTYGRESFAINMRSIHSSPRLQAPLARFSDSQL